MPFFERCTQSGKKIGSCTQSGKTINFVKMLGYTQSGSRFCRPYPTWKYFQKDIPDLGTELWPLLNLNLFFERYTQSGNNPTIKPACAQPLAMCRSHRAAAAAPESHPDATTRRRHDVSDQARATRTVDGLTLMCPRRERGGPPHSTSVRTA